MIDIKNNLAEIKKEIPNEVALVAVSKTKPNEDIIAAAETGQLHFGENKVQELTNKIDFFTDNTELKWHMIGHLQRNKVKYLVGKTHLIHSVDSERLLKEINKRSKNEGVKTAVLLQMHIAEESSKFGFDEKELFDLIASDHFKGYENIEVKGLMGMATFTEEHQKVCKEFRYLRNIYEKLNTGLQNLNTLSMGMSNDYKIAIDEGSNMIRIGSSIFGERNYQ